MASPTHSPSTPATHHDLKPSTPGSKGSLVECTRDPDLFVFVEVHTAKCTRCDGRNNGPKMRRCPGCTWQICEPCHDKREAAGEDPLQHGNAHTTPKPASTIRRRLINPTSLISSSAKKGEVNNETTEEGDIPESKASVTKEVMLPTNGEKRRRDTDRKAKNKARILDVSDDDEHLLDPPSPTPVPSSKRLKPADNASLANSKGSPVVKEKYQTALQHSTAPQALLLSPSKSLDIKMSQGVRMAQDLDRVREYYGMEGGYQQQHLLTRCEPVSSRTVKIPAIVQRNFQPRKGEEEIMRDIQEKVREKLALRAQVETAPASVSLEHQKLPQKKTRIIRDVVDAEVRNLHHGLVLDEDQQDALVSAMKDAARKFRNKVVTKMAESFRYSVAKGLDMLLDQLTKDQQQDLIRLIQGEAARKLQEYEEEAQLDAPNPNSLLGPATAPVTLSEEHSLH